MATRSLLLGLHRPIREPAGVPRAATRLLPPQARLRRLTPLLPLPVFRWRILLPVEPLRVVTRPRPCLLRPIRPAAGHLLVVIRLLRLLLLILP